MNQFRILSSIDEENVIIILIKVTEEKNLGFLTNDRGIIMPRHKRDMYACANHFTY